MSSLAIEPMFSRFKAMKGTGCSICHFTGYHGRIGLFEVFLIDSEIKQLIHKGAGESEILRAAKLAGMTTLLEDGIEKIRTGKTTCAEVLRVLGPQNTMSMVCPGCSNILMERLNFCPNCGHRIAMRCINCGSHLEPFWKICAMCGVKIG
jgi:predicted RNA-binding Zn-ribbon protein involved in translation (DUF1610 family)